MSKLSSDNESIEDFKTLNGNGTPLKNHLLFSSKGDFSHDILVRCLNLALNGTTDCSKQNSIELVKLKCVGDKNGHANYLESESVASSSSKEPNYQF